MNVELLVVVLCCLLNVALFWYLPRRWGDAVSVLTTVAAFTILSPFGGIWLGVTTVMTPWVMHLGVRFQRRGTVVALWTALLVVSLFLSRELPALLLVGGAYFVFRHLHVLLDWWMGKAAIPSTWNYLRYQFFLPVILAGPIHRHDHFDRQCRRRQYCATDLAAGAERVLLGLFQYIVVAGFFLEILQDRFEAFSLTWPLFYSEWLLSALGWVSLYVSFSGLASVALGFAQMLGLRIEENFRQPWRARNLIDFWARWHITLSLWCRDYVFSPVSALTRKPIVGLVCAMLVIGLWHDTSVYYVLWALWQSLGIGLTHVVRAATTPLMEGSPRMVAIATGPVFVAAWLSLTSPVVNALLRSVS